MAEEPPKKPVFDWYDDVDMRGDRVGCLFVILGFVLIAVAMVILYTVARELP